MEDIQMIQRTPVVKRNGGFQKEPTRMRISKGCLLSVLWKSMPTSIGYLLAVMFLSTLLIVSCSIAQSIVGYPERRTGSVGVSPPTIILNCEGDTTTTSSTKIPAS